MVNSIKSKIIPESMKENIDDILEQQLFNANRYYAESNPNISKLMQYEANKSSIEFLSELRQRWNWHNIFYEDLAEKAYLELIKINIMELTPKEIEDLKKIYKTCCLIDEATLVTSGAIKKHLEKQLCNISLECEGVDYEDAIFMLLTPPVNSFFSQYQIDHLSYIILLKSDLEKAKKYRKYLLKQYHANDEKIFESRFNKKFLSKLNCSIEELYNDISSYKISDEYKTKHFYFTLEHSDRKAYRDIITYDNVDEKFISCQLIGISGFLIRKQILKYLDESKMLSNNGYIYEFSNSEIIEGLNKLLEERKRSMQKNIKPYRQGDDTCAIACMLMALEYYKIIPKANRMYEKKYYKSYRSYYLDGTPFSALAWHFAKNGLETELIHSEEEIFKNTQNMISNNIFEKSMEEYKRFLTSAESKGAKIKNGIDINCELLKRKLEEDKLVILAGQIGDYLHAILLCGYEGEKFVVCDPLVKSKQLKTYSEISSFMNTSIGKWCVTITEKKQNKDILMDNLDSYQNDAKAKLLISDKIEENLKIKKENKILKK